MRAVHWRRALLPSAFLAAIVACGADGTSTSTTAVAPGLIGRWESANGQLPFLQVTFTTENAGTGAGVLTVAPIRSSTGAETPVYTGDSLAITSGSNSGSAVTFFATLGANPAGGGRVFSGPFSFSGTLSGGILTGTVNFTPPRTTTHTFDAQPAVTLVLTRKN